MEKPLRERSALVYVLVALIPYSKPNLLLTYKPGLFFRELEKISRYKKATLEKAYYRGLQKKLIEHENKIPRLTSLGQRKIAPFMASQLDGNVELMVIFDIPEDRAQDRRILRSLLRAWDFKPVQKSVWTTKFDYRKVLIEAINELDLEGFVEIHESARLHPKFSIK